MINIENFRSQINSLKWLIDGVNYNDKNIFPETDEPFIINIKDMNNTFVNNILVMNIGNVKPVSKYECILNDNVTVRTHFITIIGNYKHNQKTAVFPFNLNP